jgi:hypothetical protein
MRLFLAGIIIAMLANSTYAQDVSTPGIGMGRRGGKGRKPAQNTEQQAADKAKQKAADEAYKAALKKIPDQKYDPWQSAR